MIIKRQCVNVTVRSKIEKGSFNEVKKSARRNLQSSSTQEEISVIKNS